ncbi:MAG: translation initiation factor eIF-1A [Candidatus Aenigmatarchaeota archaeon]
MYKKRYGNQNAPEIVTRVRTPRDNELFGIVEAALGNSNLRVRCQDNKMRICRIPGKLRKRVWMHVGDTIIVKPWSIQGDTRGDAISKYRNAEVEWLRRRNLLTL